MKKNGSRFLIIGRPNVGKSTLFNRLVGWRRALVGGQRGLTRDIIEGTVFIGDSEYTVFDSAGMESKLDQELNLFADSVDGYLFCLNAREGFLPDDLLILNTIRKKMKPYLVVINKCDSENQYGDAVAEFSQMGVENFILAGFERNEGVSEIREWISSFNGIRIADEDQSLKSHRVSLCLMGKPNVGKSSLFNRLVYGEGRAKVSAEAGTTRDPLNAKGKIGDLDLNIIDTAGLRRSSSQNYGIEGLAAMKGIRALETEADLVLLIVDAISGPTVQDARILNKLYDTAKPVIVVANKVDLFKGDKGEGKEKFRQVMSSVFHFSENLPLVFISAKEGSGLQGLAKVIRSLHKKMHCRIATPDLNRFFSDVIRRAPAPVVQKRNVKFYYLTQTKQVPPAFIAFANRPDGVNPSYRRFLIRQIQEKWNLKGLPVRLFVMGGKHAKNANEPRRNR